MRLRDVPETEPTLPVDATPTRAGHRRVGAMAETASGPTEASPLAGLAPGTRVGRYEIVEMLGAGGMGAIYRAHDPYLSRDVALKLLHPYRHHLPEAGEYHARLLREAQALGRLSHPNVVAAHDVGTHDGAVFIAMELVEGVSLVSWLESRPSRQELLRAMIAAGHGLAAAHAAGVLHRDFKPPNVMVSPDGRVRVVDFGLARAMGDRGEPDPMSPDMGTPLDARLLSQDLTRGGALMGTLGFMAPEQLTRGDIDARADQFGYAATIFYALAGRTPFPCRTSDEYRAALHRKERPALPSSVPRRLRRVVDRGLAVRAADRFPSVEAMVQALERAAARRRRAPAVVAAAGIAAAGLVVAMQVRMPESADRCTVDRAAFAGAWDGSRRVAVERAFAATGRAHAGATFQRVAARLDGIEARWLAMRKEACVATVVRREQTDEVLAMRTACLDRTRAQVGDLMGVFEQAADGVIDRAVDAVRQLDDVERCADIRTLMTERPPEDPALRVEVAAIESAIDGVRSARLAGRWDEALARAEELRARAQRADHKPTLARATYELALTQANKGLPASEETHHRALALASEAGRSQLSARIAVSLLHLMLSAGRWRDAELVIPMVEAAVAQAAQPPVLQMEVFKGRAQLSLAKGEHDAALASLDSAASLTAQLRHDGEHQRLSIDNEVARVLLEKGDVKAAARKLAEVIDGVKKVQGPTHPRVLMAYNNLANVLVQAEDKDGALAALAESRKLAAAVGDLPSLAYIPATEGRVWRFAGDCGRAVPLFREALERFTAGRRPGGIETMTTHQHLGQCLVELGQVAEAIPHLEAWAGRARELGIRPAWRAEADFALARALWSIRPERRRAVRVARAALKLSRETGAPTDEIERWLASRR